MSRRFSGLMVLLGVLGYGVAVQALPESGGVDRRPSRSHSLCADSIAWRGNNNASWREIGAVRFTNIIRAKGFADNPDFRLPRVRGLLDGIPTDQGVREVNNVLVIGPGFDGREIRYLLDRTAIQRIHAVEAGEAQFEVLSPAFASDRRVALYLDNIATWQRIGDDPVDLVFWMFAGILELDLREKKLAILRLHHAMVAKGVVVVDTPAGQLTSSLELSAERGAADSVQLFLAGADVPNRRHLNLHPVDHATMTVRHGKITDLFERDKLFSYDGVVFYRAEVGKELRRLDFFVRNAKEKSR